MNNLDLTIILCISVLAAFLLAQRRAKLWHTSSTTNIHSLPSYYGYLTAIWTLMPALTIFIIWSIFELNAISGIIVSKIQELQILDKESLELTLNKIYNIANSDFYNLNDSSSINNQAANLFIEYKNNSLILKCISVISIAILSFLVVYFFITPNTKARNKVEKLITYLLLSCALIAILTTIGIIVSVLFESLEFFSQISIFEFLFSTNWSPQIAIREGQTGNSGAFGAVPLFWGTVFISFIAMLVAAPLGLISAIYLAKYATPKFRSIAKPLLEILAGIPTVVYGFFAALTIGPAIRDFCVFLKELGISLDIEIIANITISTESALAVGLVMGTMIVPFILSISDDVISTVPNSIVDGSIAMGATKSETVWRVIIPAALPGIVGGFLLAISRAIGETMIVLMAAGVAANLTANPLDTVTTITTQIVVLLTGDQEFDNVKTLAAFALGLSLFVTTLIINVIALYIVRKYREQYE